MPLSPQGSKGWQIDSLIAEEIQNTSLVVPRAMIATTMLNGILGFAAFVAILFCVGDIEAAERTSTGYPFMEIFYAATGSAGGATAMACAILALIFCATIGVIATASRMTWAFARDNGLPGSRWLSKACYSNLRSCGLSTFVSEAYVYATPTGRAARSSTALFNRHDCHYQSSPRPDQY